MMIILIGDTNNNPLNTLCEKPDWIILFAPNIASQSGLSHERHRPFILQKKALATLGDTMGYPRTSKQ
jgi:hypothetical protein